jgi:hypothetical protein
MKKTFSVVLVASMLVSVASAQGWRCNDHTSDLRASLNYWVPGEGDFSLYDQGYGVELQYRKWAWEPFGVAFSFGVSEWDADELRIVNTTDYGGSALVVPIGGSALIRIFDMTGWNMALEAGLRYLIVESDIDFLYTPEDRREELDIDNNIVGVVALDYENYLGERWSLFGTAGYQFDLIKGDITSRIGDMPENEMPALYLRLGASLTF